MKANFFIIYGSEGLNYAALKTIILKFEKSVAHYLDCNCVCSVTKIGMFFLIYFVFIWN